MEAAQEIEYFKTSIRRMIARVPPSVNGGSNDTAVAFKKAAVDAQREVAKSKVNLAKLKQAHNVLASYY